MADRTAADDHASRPPPNLATLAILYREPEAAVLISMLRARGIAAFATAWCFAAMSWHCTVAIDGIAVLVPRRDLAAAIALVGDPAELPLPQRNFRGGRLRNLVIVVVFGLLPPLLIGTFGLILPPRAKGVYARNAIDEVFG